MTQRDYTFVVITVPEPGDTELPPAILGGATTDDLFGSLRPMIGCNTIERVGPLLGGRIDMLIDEEGKYASPLRCNIRATDLARREFLGVDDFIAGNVVLVSAQPDAEYNIQGLDVSLVLVLMQIIPIKGAVAWLQAQRDAS